MNFQIDPWIYLPILKFFIAIAFLFQFYNSQFDSILGSYIVCYVQQGWTVGPFLGRSRSRSRRTKNLRPSAVGHSRRFPHIYGQMQYVLSNLEIQILYWKGFSPALSNHEILSLAKKSLYILNKEFILKIWMEMAFLFHGWSLIFLWFYIES